jgi:hypothetical protein
MYGVLTYMSRFCRELKFEQKWEFFSLSAKAMGEYPKGEGVLDEGLKTKTETVTNTPSRLCRTPPRLRREGENI